MDIIVTIFYVLFCVCVVYPPAECVSAGFTIAQIFESLLGSEDFNFVDYQMKRTTVTALVHAILPFGYVLTMWCAGWRSEWVQAAFYFTIIIFLLVAYKMLLWWEYKKNGHPVVKALQPYVEEGMDWRIIANNINCEFQNACLSCNIVHPAHDWNYVSVDKIFIPLTTTSKIVVTESYIILVTQYRIYFAKQSDSTLVATGADNHSMSISGDGEVQFLNIQVIPSRDNVKPFSFRISTAALRDDLQPRLERPVRVPENLRLLPTLMERFISVFKVHVGHNPVYLIDQEPEQCIGCMQETADVKINRQCDKRHPDTECVPCECRVAWCVTCMAQWWAARARGPPEEWLRGRCTCPACRAPFCVRDLCFVRLRGPEFTV